MASHSDSPAGDLPPSESDSAFSRWAASLVTALRGRDPSLRESLEDVIEEHGDDTGDLTREERVMLLNIVSLRELKISDVMVPRADIVAIDIAMSFDEMVQVFRQATHSRLPLYRESMDEIVGMVHIKDVVAAMAGHDDGERPRIADIKRRVLFVPPSMAVVDLLLNMRINRTHMALVIDEYGGTDGLVTIEDLIEQIVGEIEDEHDEQSGPLIRRRRNSALDVDARALVTEPSILLADEPTGNLDSKTTVEIMALFDELHSEGQTLIVVTHEDEIADHCHRVVEMKDGKIARDSGSPQGLS